MLGLRVVGGKTSRIVTHGLMPKRNYVVSGPPKVRISLAEKAGHGVLIVAAIITTPMWVLANLKHYKNRG